MELGGQVLQRLFRFLRCSVEVLQYVGFTLEVIRVGIIVFFRRSFGRGMRVCLLVFFSFGRFYYFFYFIQVIYKCIFMFGNDIVLFCRVWVQGSSGSRKVRRCWAVIILVFYLYFRFCGFCVSKVFFIDDFCGFKWLQTQGFLFEYKVYSRQRCYKGTEEEVFVVFSVFEGFEKFQGSFYFQFLILYWGFRLGYFRFSGDVEVVGGIIS